MKKLLAAIVLAAALLSCTNVNQSIGGNFIATNQKYDFHTAEFNLEDVWNRSVDSLTAYSSRRINFGTIRDKEYGLFRRGCVVTLVPVYQDVDFGQDPIFQRFRFKATPDSVSMAESADANILQNVNVYALTDTIDNKSINAEPLHSAETITYGTPVFNGTDSLAFDMTREFGEKYIKAIQELEDKDHIIDSVFSHFTAKLPGIYVTMDPPTGYGGRINLFELSCLSANSGSYYRNSNEAILTIRSTYNGVQKDTSFLFIAGEPTFYDEREYVKNNSKFYQYAFNHTTHETASLEGKVDGKTMLVEGGGGLKPVISAESIRDKVRESILSKGADPEKVIINKATLILPFEEPEDYLEYESFPTVLSPTVWINSSFAGLYDASSSTENQGDINRSLSAYQPDITHHLQEIIRKSNDDRIDDYDIWFLTVHTETEETSSGLTEEQSRYYQQLAYANYYNQLYGDYGGYGGYGGYGYGGYGYGGYGYGGYGYNNYYNYMMMSSMYSNMYSNKVTTSQELDKDRFYKIHLYGPANDENTANIEQRIVPKLRVTYCIPRE
jgi:hypothetical protein